MRRWFVFAVGWALMIAGCGGSGDGVNPSWTSDRPITPVATQPAAVSVPPATTPPTTSTVPPATTPPTTSAAATTTTAVMVDAEPDYYRFGEEGLYRVVGGVEEQLSGEQILEVLDDHLGGVIFTTADGTVRWLRAGEATPAALANLDPGNERFASVHPDFTGMIDGQPHIFYGWSMGPDRASAEDMATTCGDRQLMGRNLLTNTVTGYVCLPLEDAWLGIQSVGGGQFVGAFGIASGAAGTSRTLLFWNLDGEELQPFHNPFPQSCEPCELSAITSPDGSLVAYRFRPDSKWPPQQWDDATWEERWEQSKSIPAELAVRDMNTGQDTWRVDDLPASVALVDFDGRYLVTRPYFADGAQGSTVYDTRGVYPPLAIPGTATLIRGGTPSAAADPDRVWTTERIENPVIPPCCAMPAIAPVSPAGEIPQTGSPTDGFYDASVTRSNEHPNRLQIHVRRWVSCDDLPDQCVPDWPPDGVTPDSATTVMRYLELTSDLTVVIWPVWEAPDARSTALVGTGDAFALLLSGIDTAFLDWALTPHRQGQSLQEIVDALLDHGGDPEFPFGPLPGFAGSPSYRGPHGAYLTPHLLATLDSAEPWPPGHNGLYDWWTTLEIRDGQPILYVYANQVAG